jgi:arylamine N-acetyltransferase
LDRATPGLEHILSANLRGGGGLCGHSNIFLNFQLQCLGFKSHLLHGTFVRTGIEGSHNLIAVNIPAHLSKEKTKRDKTFIVDVGCGVPISEPIPLDELPFTRRAGGLDFRYERVDDFMIQRINEGGDALMGKVFNQN